MINRINLILKAKNITAKQFAEEIGIQPSGMSHIMSGRNNPSLDFVLKVLRRYPEIDAGWLISGKGQMYYLGETTTNGQSTAAESFPQPQVEQPLDTSVVPEATLFDTSDYLSAPQKEATVTGNSIDGHLLVADVVSNSQVSHTSAPFGQSVVSPSQSVAQSGHFAPSNTAPTSDSSAASSISTAPALSAHSDTPTPSPTTIPPTTPIPHETIHIADTLDVQTASASAQLSNTGTHAYDACANEGSLTAPITIDGKLSAASDICANDVLPSNNNTTPPRHIERIVVFYSDKTFIDYRPETKSEVQAR